MADPAATLPGGSVTLDASGTTGADGYLWEKISGPAGLVLTGETTAKPKVTLPFFLRQTDTTAAAAWPAITYKVTATNKAQGTEAVKEVTIPVKKDVLTIGTARHKVGTELRIDGTSLIDGAAGALTPPTQVLIFDATPGRVPVKLGSSPVDTLGAWSYRVKPGPTSQISRVRVQSSRGGELASVTLATR